MKILQVKAGLNTGPEVHLNNWVIVLLILTILGVGIACFYIGQGLPSLSLCK